MLPMLGPKLNYDIIGALAISTVAFLSGPAVKYAWQSHRRRLEGYTEVDEDGNLYKDDDGIATEDSIRAYSDTRPRVAVLLGVILGLGTSVAANVVRLVENGSSNVVPGVTDWAETLCWVFLCLQYACLPKKHHHNTKFRITLVGSVSAILTAACVALRHGYEALERLTDPAAAPRSRVLALLYLGQFLLAIATLTAFSSFQLRPDVYHNMGLVDQQYTLSLLSRLSFTWNRGIFGIAEERDMTIDDIPNLDYSTRSENVKSRFLENRTEEPLWRQLIRMYAAEIVLQWVLTLVISFLSLLPQLLLYGFLADLERGHKGTSSDPSLFIMVFGLLFCQVLQVGFNNWLKWVTASRLEIPLESLLQSMVFSKALNQYETATPGLNHSNDKYQQETKKESDSKQSIINHMRLDSERVTMFCSYNTNLPLAVFKFIFAGGFAVHLMGWLPMLCGFSAAVIMVPISTSVSRKLAQLNRELMTSRDGKAHLLTEALQGMRQIRYAALEHTWEKKIMESRSEELRQFWKSALWQCLTTLLMNLGPVFLASAAFGMYVWQNGTHIRPSVIFTSLGLFDQLEEAVSLLPTLQVSMLEAWTSIERLEKYFRQPDKDVIIEPANVIELENATVSWPTIKDDNARTPSRGHHPEARSVLRNATLRFPLGGLSVITGKTGSGKSLLLAALLGEVNLLDGIIRMPVPQQQTDDASRDAWIVPGRTAFVSQIPWIESGSVRDNILFGLRFVEGRYRKVLAACDLEKDLAVLAHGDDAQVGPKGVTLSGGQRWRIALARALYSEASILVLDDVLSAVDAHVGQLIVDRALTGELARGRTIILATHHAELVLPHARYVVRLKGGEVEAAEELSPLSDVSEVAGTAGPACLDQDGPSAAQAGYALSGPTDGLSSRLDQQFLVQNQARPEEEKRETGRVKWKVYMAYYGASGGILPWLLAVFLVVFSHGMTVARNWSLKELSRHSTENIPFALFTTQTTASLGFWYPKQVVTDTDDDDGINGVVFWLLVYIGIELGSSVVELLRVVAFYYIGFGASKALFQRMTHAILRAPLHWIDTVPAGRVINRFTSDIFTLDKQLAPYLSNAIKASLFLLVIIAASVTVSVYIIIFGSILLLLYIRLAHEFILVARQVKRINSVSHSPIYDQFSSVLSGLSTIRAFGRTNDYMSRMYQLIDNGAKATWALELSNRWMTFRMGVVGALFVSIVATAVSLREVNAAMAGFSLAFALRYTNALTSLLQAMTAVELGFNACERVLEYAEIEAEPEGGEDPPAAWPAEGRIEVKELTVRYAKNLPPVLNGLNFTVGAGERVGIVGRTGAGKSTLAAVLFRLLENVEGTILIDGIDVSKLKLSQLRSRLAIIPQDPFLFSGTLRSNLDIEDVLEDRELFEALKRVHLIEEQFLMPSIPMLIVTPSASSSRSASTLSTLGSRHPSSSSIRSSNPGPNELRSEPRPNPIPPVLPRSNVPLPVADPSNPFSNLSLPINAGGLNLSQGQRQLVCLARAMLRRPKIIVLDEATSAVDRATDTIIQESLRETFAATGCTVLVIAHRLSTVADFDRVMVLDGGRVKEIGAPRELLIRGMRKDKENGSRRQNRDSKKNEGGLEDGVAGAFWELVKKSAEKEKLIEMILGEEKDGIMRRFLSDNKGKQREE